MDTVGLTSKQVAEMKSLGLSNQKIDSYSPSYSKIVRRNLFNIMNIVLIGLLIMLVLFGLYREVAVFATYVLVNTVMNSYEEIRIKRRLEKLLQEFQKMVTVIRDGKEQEIPANEVVQGDYIKAKEGEGIAADGTIVSEKYLQIDESPLTGESKYLKKNESDSLLSGSFIVTGECVYKVEKVGQENYFNQLGEKSATYKKRKSYLEKMGDRFITFFVITGLTASGINYYFAHQGGLDNEHILLSVTTLLAVIIPQTLIFLFNLSFVISITKLAKHDILIQKRGSMDDLATIDTLCIDKTGTITTNTMTLETAQYWNMEEQDLAKIYATITPEIQGRNKTSETLETYFENIAGRRGNVTSPSGQLIDQIPFTSKSKFSAFLIRKQGTGTSPSHILFILGAFTKLENLIDPKIKSEVTKYVNEQEKNGVRVLTCLWYENSSSERLFKEMNENIDTLSHLHITTLGIGVFSIKENLNPGINEVLERLRNQDIEIKVISGDSYNSVCEIAEKVGLDISRAVDLSQTNEKASRLALEKTIFTRATPEDKFEIITALKKQGKNVAMVGDGINDVLSMKQATVSIAMEHGASITRDIADIVLLKNDYKKIPEIFYEGDNLLFNLKLTTKIYFAKAFIGYALTIFFALKHEIVPILPTTTLLFSFIGTTFPSYAVNFSRQEVHDDTPFTKNVLTSATPTGILIGFFLILLYVLHKDDMNFDEMNTYLVNGLLAYTLIYSFFLMYQVGKFTNKIYISAIIAFAVLFGYVQGVLPFYHKEYDTPFRVLLIYLAFWAAAAVYFWLRHVVYKKVSNTYLKKSVYIVPVGLLLLALFFPSRPYYATDPFNMKFYPTIAITSIVFFICIIVIHKIIAILRMDR